MVTAAELLEWMSGGLGRKNWEEMKRCRFLLGIIFIVVVCL